MPPGKLRKLVKDMDSINLRVMVNLSGGSPGGDGLEDTLAEARAVGHTTVFVNPDFREIRKGAGYGARIAANAEGTSPAAAYARPEWMPMAA